MKRDEGGFINFSGGLDPDIETTLDQGRRREEARRKSPARAPSSKKVKDAQRNRRMIDISPELEQRLEEIAAELSVPVSSLITWLVDRALAGVSMDDLIDAREPSRSMRYEYVLRPRKGVAKRLR